MRPTLKGLIGLGLLIGLGCFVTGSFAQSESASLTPPEMLPGSAVFYARIDGANGHEETYAETAAYQAIEESGLRDLFQDVLNLLSEQEQFTGFIGVYEHLAEYGFSLAIAVDAPESKPVQSWGTIVVPAAGEGVNLLESLVVQISEEQLEVKAKRVRQRQIRYIDLGNPTVEVAWWAEGDDLILALGMNGISNTLDVIEGKRPNITTHRLWEQYDEVDESLDVTQLVWFDAETLRESFSHVTIPVPNQDKQAPLTVGGLLEILGLQTLDHTAMLTGYLGDSIWTEVIVHAPGERTGLLSLLDQETFTIEDLPPIPLHQQGISVFSFNSAKAYTVIYGIIRQLLEYAPPEELDNFENSMKKLQDFLGFPPETLLQSLGSLHCLYTDSAQGFLGLGGIGLVQVEHRDALEACLTKLFQRLLEAANREKSDELVIREFESEGRKTFRFEIARFPLITPTVSLNNDWLIVGLTPQAVNAQIMRFDERIFSWAIDQDLSESLEMMPEEMTSLSVVDPAASFTLTIGLAPSLLGIWELGMKENGSLPRDGRFPIDIHSIPPAELVTQSLFPNVGVSTVDENGWHAYVRQSFPAIPLAGGPATSASDMGAVAIGAAILLPAIQNARHAARQIQSKNNLKQLGLAVHIYHGRHDQLPPGTIPNDSLTPEEQLSWFVEILPSLGLKEYFDRIDQKAAWNADVNKEPLSAAIGVFQNPLQTNTGSGPYGKTDYVGIAGWGEEAPNAPVTDPNAGMFGYGRKTRLSDVIDGNSNTIMISESTGSTNWGEGGRATIRAFTAAPYLNGPDGIGSPTGRDVNMVFGNGHVRSINSEIDPNVLKAISTIAGGEIVNDF